MTNPIIQSFIKSIERSEEDCLKKIETIEQYVKENLETKTQLLEDLMALKRAKQILQGGHICSNKICHLKSTDPKH